MSREFHPASKPRAEVQPTRILQRPSSALTNTVATDLSHREYATAEMVRALDEKIGRLTQARADRIHALHKLRSAIAQAILAGRAAPERHAKFL